MKGVIFYVLVLLGLVLAKPQGDTFKKEQDERQQAINARGCYYIMGKCREPCPVGTHAYTTGCNFLMPEATCANPHPVLDTRGGHVCDFSSCYCDSPTVRDQKINKCVTVDKCS